VIHFYVRFIDDFKCSFAVLQTGATTAASGPAYAEFGKTKVIISV
jgi:hypothetical protein